MSSEHLKPIVTAWVKAGMKPLYKKVVNKEKVGSKKVTKTKGLFKKTSYEEEVPIYESKEDWIPTGEYSYTEVDIKGFSQKIGEVCNDLVERGYDILSITPVNSGRYNYQYKETGSAQRIIGDTEKITGGGFGYGYGYGVTDGVIITAKLGRVDLS